MIRIGRLSLFFYGHFDMDHSLHRVSAQHLSTHPRMAFLQGVRDIFPLTLAVLPWGILAGSMAIETGLSFAQAFSMSAIIFAGAAQLVSLGMLKAGASTVSIVITILFLTSQHLIYALNFREPIHKLLIYQRLAVGFLLTDELFAVGSAANKSLRFAYLFGAGLCFYLGWCLFSLIGIALANTVSNLDRLHLDFSIVVVFILMIVPMIKNKATFIGVLITMISAALFKYYQFSAGLICSGLLGMFAAMLCAKRFVKDTGAAK